MRADYPVSFGGLIAPPFNIVIAASPAIRVRNSAKASTVFAFMGYSPIAPTDSEQAALQTVAVRWSQLAVCHVLGGEPTRFEPVGDSRLVQSILSSFDPTR